MDNTEKINMLIGVKESYQAPDRLLGIMFNVKERKKLFRKMLELFESDISYDWFHEYFMEEHSDRKDKKQDFTPNGISDLISKITDSRDGTTYEIASGTGGMIIRKWLNDRDNSGFFNYRPSNYYYIAEELSDRAIPFLIFNMVIRGMNGEIRHIDSLTRECKGVFFIQNIEDSYISYSQLNIMPYNKSVEEICNVKFTDFRYKNHMETSIEQSSVITGINIKEYIDENNY